MTQKFSARGLPQAPALVPTPSSVATAGTDHDGQYEFVRIPAAGRYHGVEGKTVEGAEPLVMAGIANKLPAGERVTLNLSADDPRTRAAIP